jgi:hypothetical protein
MLIGAKAGLGTTPRRSNSDLAGKFSDTRFRINGTGYDSGGRIIWPEHVNAAHTDEVRSIFKAQGWTISESSRSSAATKATKGKSSLYLHAKSFCGVCENTERERLAEIFKNANTFVCIGVEVN